MHQRFRHPASFDHPTPLLAAHRCGDPTASIFATGGVRFQLSPWFLIAQCEVKHE